MLEIYDLKKSLDKFEINYTKLLEKINLDKINGKLGELTEIVNSPNFWNDPINATKISKQYQTLEKTLKATKVVADELETFKMLMSMFEENEITLEELNEEYNSFEKIFSDFELTILLSGEYDDNGIILEIHPGAGGTESQDWADMLYNMYVKYFKKNNYKVKVIDYQPGDPAGIKSVTLEVNGEKTYGKLKGENGVHRLVRISPFDSAAKRHTSFASVKVMPIIENSQDIEISDSDLKIDVYRSSGAGGQSVNTTDSAVRITHLPTNTVVTCQNERSQIQNKEQAMKILRSKLLELKLQQQEEEKAKLAGVQLSNGWGSQKRSYVLHPYKLVKDHHVNFESSQAEKVLSGDIEDFLYHNLLKD